MLAELWLTDQSAGASVLDAMRNQAWREILESVWQNEVLPVFDALGKQEAARAYLVDVRNRFENPFLDHRLADIARNHEEKKQRRFKPVIDLARELGLEIEQKRLVAALQ